MRVLEKFSEFASWRWAPTISLIGATLLYIALVLLLVPEEVGIPANGAKFTPRGTLQRDEAGDAGTGLDLTNRVPSFSESEAHASPASPPQSPAFVPPPVNQGRRGFSPPLERSEPPPAPEPPPPAPVVNADPPPAAPPPPPPPEAAPEPAPLPPPALEPAAAEGTPAPPAEVAPE